MILRIALFAATTGTVLVPAKAYTCQNVVYCVNGMAGGQTCAAACNGNCCGGGSNACGNGRIRVCADDYPLPSCWGQQACYNIGYNGESGVISQGSCRGRSACHGAAASEGSSFASISGESCQGNYVCNNMATSLGTVGHVSGGSCKGGDGACGGLGSGRWPNSWTILSRVGDVTNSCRGLNACRSLGIDGAHVGNIIDACTGGEKACYQMARSNEAYGGQQIGNCCNDAAHQCSGHGCNVYTDRTRTWRWVGGCIGYVHDLPPPPQMPITCAATDAPTASPTATGPLALNYDKLEANFTSGAPNELEVGFFVGVGRNVTVEVLKTCDKEADEVPPSLYTEAVSHDPTESNLTHAKIIVGFNFNKAEMINSSLWNSTSETLTFCQVTSVTVPDQIGGGSFVVLQDKREIEVKFDLDADFDVDVDLGDRTIRNETEFINFDNDVEAYKCRGGSDNSFSVDDGALPPNTELAICIRVQNNTSVIIDRLAYMVIDQDENDSTNLPMVFVNDGNPELGEGLTKMPPASQGVIVKTRLPQGPDYFQFESGLSLNISGTVDLKLATGRKLRALAGENDVAGEEGEVAEINVVVGLQSSVDGFGPIGSSDGHAIVGKGLAAIGLMVLAVTVVMM